MDYIKHKSYTLLLPFVCYSTIVAFLMYFIGKLDVIDYIKSGWGECIMVYPYFIYGISTGTDNFLGKEKIWSDALLCYTSFISDIVCGIMKYPYHGVCRFFFMLLSW